MGTYLSLIGKRWGGGGGGRLFETGCLLTFSAFRLGAYSRLCAYSNRYGTQKKFTAINEPSLNDE